MKWAEEAIVNIKNYQIKHRNWEKAVSKGFASLFASTPGEVVSIVGPSRAGKTRLISELTNLLVGESEINEEGVMPALSLLAANRVKGAHFETKDFIIHALEKSKHPIYGVNSPGDQDGFERDQLLKRTTEATLARALVNTLKARNCRYVFIDESQHVLHIVGKESGAARFFDSMKAMAQEGNFVLVLVGTYPLLNALSLASHLIGRDVKVVIDRYRTNIDDVKAFDQILESYSKFISLPKEIKSLRHWNSVLYQGSLGCIGHLNRWLRSALTEAIVEGSETLTKAYLLKTVKSKKELGTLAQEILVGEELLGLEEGIGYSENASNTTHNTKHKRKCTKKPFQRNPHRYPLKGRV